MSGDCSSDIERLVNFNVHNTRETPSFELDNMDLVQECKDKGPLGFCMFPPEARLKTMCQTTLDTYFEQVLSGTEAVNATDLPIVWDAKIDLGDVRPWIPFTTGSNALESGNVHMLTSPDVDYVGLPPLPSFKSMSISNMSQLLFGVTDGFAFKSNAQRGMVQKVSDVKGQDALVENLQLTGLNAEGTLGFVMFSESIWFWQNNPPRMEEQVSLTGSSLNYAQIFKVQGSTHIVVVGKKQQDTTACRTWHFVASNATNVFTETHQNTVNVSPQFGIDILWATVIPANLQTTAQNQSFTMVALDQASPSTLYSVFLVSNTQQTLPLSARWTVPRGFPPQQRFSPGWTAACRLAVAIDSESAFVVHACWRNQTLLFSIILQQVGSTVGTNQVRPERTLQVTENFTQTNFGIKGLQVGTGVLLSLETKSSLLVALPQQGLQTQPSQGGIMAINPGASQVWVFETDSRKLFCLQLPLVQQSVWTSNAQLYYDGELRVSDSGIHAVLSTPIDYATTTWFFGHKKTSIPANFLAGPIASPHEFVRYVFDALIPASSSNFAYLKTHIERANISGMLLQPNSFVRLYDNSNFTVITNQNQEALRRGTNDRFSSDATFKQTSTSALPLESFPLASVDGLYLLFVVSETQFLRVCFNIYNSAAFASYARQTTERVARAIDRQTSFCALNLSNPDLNVEPKDMFSDPRCVCLSSFVVFQRLFALQSIAQRSAQEVRLEANMPCILNACQDSIVLKEDTLVYNVIQGKCKGSALTLAAASLQIDPTAKVNVESALVAQVAGAQLGKCSGNSECGPGSVCVNGVCVKMCDSDAQCVTSDGLITNKCQNGVCTAPPNKNNSTNNNQKPLLLIVIFGVLSALALITLLLILFVKDKNKGNNIQVNKRENKRENNEQRQFPGIVTVVS